MILPEKRSDKLLILVPIVAMTLVSFALIVHEAFDHPIRIRDVLLPIILLWFSVCLYLAGVKKITIRSANPIQKIFMIILMIGLPLLGFVLLLWYWLELR